MAIRIKKRLWIKPRICPECGRFAVMAENYASIRCQKCHQHHRHIMKRAAKRRKFGHRSGKYTTSYRAAKKKLIEKHPYCALCGADEKLTAHHIGGGCDNKKLTVLCDDCHTAYERWNQRRRIKRCLHVLKNAVSTN